MEDNELEQTQTVPEEEAFLPEGWNEGDSLDSLLEGPKGDAETQPEDVELDSLLAETAEGPDPLAEFLAETEEKPAQPEETPEAGQEAPKPQSRKLKVKVDREEREMDVGAMSDEELSQLLQKGLAFDRVKETQERNTYREVYQQQLDAGMTEAAARMIARDAAGGKTYSLTDEPEQTSAAQTRQVSPQTQQIPMQSPQTPRGRDYRSEVEQLRALYPDVTSIPKEVAEAVKKGLNLTTAYMAYQQRMGGQAARSAERENRTLRANAARAASAPVRGVSGGGARQEKGRNIFEQGFDAGMEWK